ncbi:MAG: CHAT domain-containing protein [Candidatus Promineifilaceae bacterium]
MDDQIAKVRQNAAALSRSGNRRAALLLLDGVEQQFSADLAAQAELWKERANIHQHHDQFEKSIAATQEAVWRLKRLGRSPFDIARTRVIEVYAQAVVNSIDAALKLAGELEPHFAEFDKERLYLAVNVYKIYARAWRNQEAFNSAEKAYHQACCIQTISLEQRANLLHDMGIMMQRLGQWDKAKEYYETILRFVSPKADRHLIVKTYFNLAQLAQQQGDLQQALVLLQTARAYNLTDSVIADIGSIDIKEAEIYRLLSDTASAKSLLLAARQRFSLLKLNEELAETWIQESWLTQDPIQASKALTNAINLLRPLGVPLLLLFTELELAEHRLRQGRLTEAQTLAANAYQQLNKAKLTHRIGFASIILADALVKQNPVQAKIYYRECLGSVGILPLLAGRAWYGIGRIALLAGEIDKAEPAYERAIEIFDTMRRRLNKHEWQAGFADDKQSLSDELILAMLKSKRSDRGLLWVERGKAKALYELLANSPHPNVTGSVRRKQQYLQKRIDYVSSQLTLQAQERQQLVRSLQLATHDQHQVDELNQLISEQKQLETQIASQSYNRWLNAIQFDPSTFQQPSEQASIVFQFLNDKLYAFILANHHVNTVPLEITEKKIATFWRATQSTLLSVRSVNKRLQRLWRILIAPLLFHIRSFKRLLIIPEKHLHNIPFAALHDPETGQYLIQRWTLQLAPSLALYTYCQQHLQPTAPPLLLGYPSDPTSSNYLPNVSTEVEAIHKIWHESIVLKDGEATLVKLDTHWQTRQLFHLAGHVFYDPKDPLASGMPLADKQWLRARTLYERQDSIAGSLVVLSGCESGKNLSKGGDILGFISGFLFAGAATIVAGLWPVEDEATRILMQHFHMGLYRRLDSAEALQSAQISLIAQNYHPFFWAAFHVYGYPRTIRSTMH